MYKNSGIIAENDLVGKSIRGIISKLVLKSFADEGNEDPTFEEGTGDPTPTEPSTPTVNFEEMLAQVRKEEKEKLYPRIKSAEKKVEVLTENINGYLLEIATLKEKVAELEDSTGESEKDIKIKELEATIEQLNKQIEESGSVSEEEIRKQVEAEFEVKRHLDNVKHENKDNILETFMDDVSGNTVEEIDASVQKAIERTIETKKQLGLLDEEGNPIETPTTPTDSNPSSPIKPPVANPTTPTDKKFDAEYIRNLDPRSEEYKEWRKSVGLK